MASTLNVKLEFFYVQQFQTHKLVRYRNKKRIPASDHEWQLFGSNSSNLQTHNSNLRFGIVITL